MTNLGCLWGIASTHVAIDNFAARFESVNASVVERCNDKSADDPTRCRRKLAIRAYKLNDELMAFKRLLQHPEDINNASSRRSEWAIASKWQFQTSLTSKLLSLLRFPGAPQLHPDDSKCLHDVQRDIDEREDLAPLRAVASGQMTWQEYQLGNKVEDKTINAQFYTLLSQADIVFATPALTVEKDMALFRDKVVGIAVDEAASMSLPDLLSVWGTTLSPCLLAGDDKQLPPFVSTDEEKDNDGNPLNRFADDGKLSSLLRLKAHGWPVYRLCTQLRMGTDLFRMCSNFIYKNEPFEYGPMCQIDHPSQACGVALEAYLCANFPDMAPAEARTLQPVFVHCEDTTTFKNQGSTSPMNIKQCKIALDLATDLVQSTEIKPSDIVIITPYKANVVFMHSALKKPKYKTLEEMRLPATVDSFQGQEGEITIVVMGTTPKSGPGFTAQANRLNVMMSRQRSGLCIVGDINLGGQRLGKSKGRIDGDKRYQVLTSSGEKAWVKAGVLQEIYTFLFKAHRMIRVGASGLAESKGKSKKRKREEEEEEKTEEEKQADKKAKKQAKRQRQKEKKAEKAEDTANLD